MAVSDDQYARLLNRMTKLEETVNDLIVAQSKLVSGTQVTQLLTLTQAQIVDVSETIEALETRVSTLEQEPIS